MHLFSSMTFTRFFRLFCLLIAGSLSGQELGREVRFFPVGDMPPYRQEIRDGVAYELEPPAGSIPPREVVLGSGKTSKLSAPLSLGRISVPLKVPQGRGELVLRRKAAGDDAAPWISVDRPESGDFLLLLWRDPEKGSWEVPRSLILPDSAEAAPAGSVRVVNVSPITIAIVFEGEKIALPAGKTWQREVPTGKEAAFQIGAVDAAGNLRRIHAGSVFQNPGERTLVVVYRADGVDPRRALKAVVQREPVAVEHR